MTERAEGVEVGVGLGSVARRVAEFGPFFAVQVHPVAGSAAPSARSDSAFDGARCPADSIGQWPPSKQSALSTPWRTVADFIESPDTLRAHIDLVRAKLASANARPVGRIEPRVAASVAHLGLLARLLSPVLGIAVLCGAFPSLDPHATHWQPELGGAFPLSLSDTPPSGTPPWPTIEHLTAAFPVSPHILRDNTASALNGAATTIIRTDPALAPAVLRTLATLIGDRALARRGSCCLIYRAAPPGRAGLCGDCALTHVPGKRTTAADRDRPVGGGRRLAALVPNQPSSTG